MILFVVGFGILAHSKEQWPYLQWIGHLPGDLLVRKGEATIYLPLTTSLIFSGALSLLLSKWSRPH
ncbi:MAG: hypothetical protein HW387_1407 [Parachlamydiales bacterium]|nr:hypothetical protein [Parachlamydiales bacterium]